MSGDDGQYQPPRVEDIAGDGPAVTAAGGTPPYTSITLVDSAGTKRTKKRGRRSEETSESRGD
jgi:hypothetical protein